MEYHHFSHKVMQNPKVLEARVAVIGLNHVNHLLPMATAQVLMVAAPALLGVRPKVAPILPAMGYIWDIYIYIMYYIWDINEGHMEYVGYMACMRGMYDISMDMRHMGFGICGIYGYIYICMGYQTWDASVA